MHIHIYVIGYGDAVWEVNGIPEWHVQFWYGWCGSDRGNIMEDDVSPDFYCATVVILVWYPY